jgi:hypothetical protein
MALIRPVTLLISLATAASSSMVALVLLASLTASLASCEDCAAFEPTSEIVCASSSPAWAAEWTFCAVSSEATETITACALA